MDARINELLEDMEARSAIAAQLREAEEFMLAWKDKDGDWHTRWCGQTSALVMMAESMKLALLTGDGTVDES